MQISGSSVKDVGVVFFGTEQFSLAALQALVKNGYLVALVITKPDSPRGRGLAVTEPAVKTYANEHGIRVLQPAHLADTQADIAEIPNRIGVLSSYGKIVPASILNLFTRGIVNIHPSLLPRYRGPSPIETAVANGDDHTGVSLMRLVAKMDAGPVYAQQTVGLEPDTSAAGVYTLLAQTGASMLVRELPGIIDGSHTAHDQYDARATYTRLLSKKDAQVDPASMTADQIERHVRAYGLYPRTRMTLGSNDIIIKKARVSADGDLTVACHEGTLSIDEVVAPSGKTMTGAEFKRGYLK